jgi:glycosyltransferase involved in cell wall biosynthesis
VLAQSFADWELILWDDCSTDGSAGVCARYTDPRLRYVRADARVSIAEARNQAIAIARGEWLAFLDQDDIWLPRKLEAQNALIDADRTGRLALVYGRTLRFDRKGKMSSFDPWHGPNRLPEGEIFNELLRKPSFVPLSSAVLLRQAVLDLGRIPADIVYCPDYYLFIHISRHYQAACLQELCCLYRVHPDSMSRTYRRQINEEALHIIRGVAGPGDGAILRNRQWVHETLIGIEEIRGGGAVGPGILRILRKGSLLYLTLRPFVVLSRRLRHWRMPHL